MGLGELGPQEKLEGGGTGGGWCAHAEEVAEVFPPSPAMQAPCEHIARLLRQPPAAGPGPESPSRPHPPPHRAFPGLHRATLPSLLPAA